MPDGDNNHSSGNLAPAHGVQGSKRNSRQALGVGNGARGRRRQAVGAVELPVIDTKNLRRTNIGGSQSMPQSPTSGPITATSAGLFMARHPSIPHAVGDMMALQHSATVGSGYVKSGRMTKVPHYGRLRSVTARVLRMMDPRTLANQARRQQQQHQAEENAAAGVQADDGTHGNTAAGVLGRSIVDTVHDAAVRRRRRHSHGSLPPGLLSRSGSRESRMAAPQSSQVMSASLGRKSLEQSRFSWALSRQASRVTSDYGGGGVLSPAASDANIGLAAHAHMHASYESAIAIPMPGFFLDPESDHWVGGHSFRQRMRFPDEDLTVPASLTKRVHYEVSYDYPKNAISTARYNVVTFLPAQLAAQFSKVANIYFLFVAALQQVPGWSTTGRWSTVLPLCIFVSLSIAHEGYDDLRRHRMDHAENTQRTRVLKVKVHDRERLSFNIRDLRHRSSHSIHSFRMRSSQSIHDIGRNTIDSARRWAVSVVTIGSTVKAAIGSRMAEKRRKQRELEDSDDEDEQVAGDSAALVGAQAGASAGADEAAESVLRQRLGRGVMSLRSWRGTSSRGGGGGDSQVPTPTNVAFADADGGSGVALGIDYGDADADGQQGGPYSRLYASGAVSANDLDAAVPPPKPTHRRAISALSGLSALSMLAGHRRQPSRSPADLTGTGGNGTPAELSVPQTPVRAGPTVAFNDVVEEVSFNDDGDDTQAVNPLPENMSCRWKKKRWENVQVGDLLRIEKDEWIPADCIVIASTGFDGTCFVETAALDGETTLKQKQALDVTNGEIQTPEQLAAFNAFTYIEAPSPELYNFEGFMEIGGKRFPLTPNQLLLRGSVLRNTAYVFAQVVYAGEQTRLRLNATRNVRTKAPQIQRITNRIVVLVFLLLLVLCFVFSALGIHWNGRPRDGHWYLRDVHMPAAALIFGYIVMMNALIPISLYVTLEAVKIFQCWFIQQDIAMYHADTDTRAEARTTAINEDLGMVRYVFSDKTGTLTENIMKLRAVMVAGFSYLHVDLDRLNTRRKDDDGAAETSPGPEVPSAAAVGSSSPRVERTSSRLSFLRPSTPASPGQPQSPQPESGRQSPLLLRAPIFSRQHRRQQSLPASMLNNSNGAAPAQGGSRTLQQLAMTNRVASGSGGSGMRAPFARHIRGLSASVLRTVGGGTTASESPEPSDQLEPPLSAPCTSDSVNEPTADLETGEVASAGDPDLADDPRTHQRAADDAPVSDLQRLPSSRRIMDGVAPPSEVFRARAEWFLRCIALCHTVQPDRDPLTGRITGYQAVSPDEKALVAAAAELGYVMNNRAGPLVQLRVVASERMRDFNSALIGGGTVKAEAGAAEKTIADESFDRGVPAPDPTDRLGNYEVLDVLEFSSARKRMSVIYRCPDGRIVMMSKGADSAIWPRLLTTDQLTSNESDVSFMPRPTMPDRMGGGWRPLRRKLSHPSAAYLHSRNSSVASSSLDVMRSAGGIPEPMVFSPRALTRIGDLQQSPRTPSNLCTATDIEPSEPQVLSDEDDGKDNEYSAGNLPFAAAAAAGGMPSPLRPFRLTHRRLMSDSQFSATSDASSFNDTLGCVEVPSSFDTPSREEEEWTRARALESLHQFSTEGLRTLAYAHKEIPEAVYEAWHQRYTMATTALANRQHQVEAVCDEIEGDLLLSGVSAIEDRLQSGVPETIFKLRRAGIRVWMLTGDKVETAINIAKSCRLIDTDAVQTTKLDDEKRPAGVGQQQQQQQADGKDKMTLLVLQSTTDPDELSRVLSQALDAARAMAASVDERFETRSRMEKLRRGMKRFGAWFDPRRSKVHGNSARDIRNGADVRASLLSHDAMDNNSAKSPMTTAPGTRAGSWDKDEAAAGDSPPPPQYLETPITATNQRRSPHATEIEWAADVGHGEQSPHMQRPRSQGGDSSSNGATSTAVDHSGNASEFDGGSSSGSGSSGPSLAVVVDGETLATMESHASAGILDKFLTLGTLCDAVICSRVSPSQKALIVHNMRVRCENGGNRDTAGATGDADDVKHSKGGVAVLRWMRRCLSAAAGLFRHDNDRYMVTLAIGDGGNDIAMIQEAHVGIGIAGQEGLQASRAADFSIGQFRFLQKLLLVHGRWSYVRVSMFIMGTFYKCMAFYITQLIFQFYTGFSGTSLFESWTLSMYNTLFSILPVLVVGIFEQDLRPETLLSYPELYRDMGPRNHLFTVPLFLRRVVVIGVLHAIVAAYFPFATNLFLGSDSSSNDMYINGFVVYSIMVLVVTFKIAYVDVRRWVLFSHLSVALTLVVWFGWNGVLNHIYPKSPGDSYIVLGTFVRLMKRGNFWFQWIIFVAIALCLNVLVMLVYTVRDPVEHRITSWVAFERRQEHAKNKANRQAWLQSKGRFGQLLARSSESPAIPNNHPELPPR
ncbi:hypothetical protein LPJ53_002402 [Coemansia erecta]|uniref:P-type phospholipid transporter n=1 Tax=Coemansia erecta TaxID=147472 RepID=A0A9W8CTW1_9FUNG|nr:hypothetical protein LPJ53_002402 [Coemansia erecta]